jgi:hypothetical protein
LRAVLSDRLDVPWLVEVETTAGVVTSEGLTDRAAEKPAEAVDDTVVAVEELTNELSLVAEDVVVQADDICQDT